jgi:hypothetical protein
MKKLHFSIIIQANRETVWDAMLAPDTYRLWTAEFAVGSYFESSWATGERIRFLVPGGSGMTSVIVENRPHEFLSTKHLGYIANGVEDTSEACSPCFCGPPEETRKDGRLHCPQQLHCEEDRS